jgi:hypothetical protein
MDIKMVTMADRPPQKPKINLAMLPELLAEFVKTTGKYGERRKWQVSSAAAYLWLRLNEEKRDQLASLMWAADGDEDVRTAILGEIGQSTGDFGDPIEAVWSIVMRMSEEERARLHDLMPGMGVTRTGIMPKKSPVKFDAVAASIRSAPEHAAPAPEKRRRGRADKHD